MIESASGNGITARRDLHREQMTEQAHELAWLKDPGLIPEAALRYKDVPEDIAGRCLNISRWMIDRLADWAAAGHARLGLLETFEKHALSNEERVHVRQVFQEQAEYSYGPGIAAMSEIFAAVPAVATREGVPRTGWLTIASQAREFGSQYARSGTVVQSLARGYLDGRPIIIGKRLDPAKLTLDAETGITSVTPIGRIVSDAEKVVDQYLTPQEHSGVCVAMQANPRGLESLTMWGAVWDAFGSATERFIYPLEHPIAEGIPQPDQPDEDPYPQLLKILKREYEAQAAAVDVERLATAGELMGNILSNPIN